MQLKKDPYERDPRGTAKKAEAYLKSSGIGDKAFFGPEAEFFVFDDVRFKNDMNETGFKIDSKEGPYNSGREYENGNMGHRPGIKGGYFPVPPVDSAQDMRSEYLKAMKDMGIKVEKHHHEVAPSQHELGMYFGTLVNQADNIQLYKYAVHMVTHSFGKTATFMPKPVKGDNGSGMHVHQSIWNGNTPLFMGNEYAGLPSEKRNLIPIAWIITLLWFFFGIGPGAVIGNWVFGDPTNPDTWIFGIPSIWAWQILFWVIGVYMMWMLAYKMEFSTPSKKDL